MQLLQYLALCAFTANANPLAINAASVFCTAVNDAVTLVKQQAPASAFCSSYLSIPVATVTSTSTSTASVTTTSTFLTGTATSVAATSTITETSMTTTTSISTSTSMVDTTTTSVSTTTSTVYLSACVPPSSIVANTKRAVAVVSKPSCLQAYAVGAALSSACKCLSVPQSTTTVPASTVVTSTQTVVNQAALTTVTTTPLTTTTTTQTSTETSVTVVTSTQTSTTASIVTVTTTIVSNAIPTSNAPFKVVAKGGGSYVDGNYLIVTPPNGFDPTYKSQFSQNAAGGQQFTLSGDGYLLTASPDTSGNTRAAKVRSAPNPAAEVIFSPGQSDDTSPPANALKCAVTIQPDASCPIVCSQSDGGTTNIACGPIYRHGTQAQAARTDSCGIPQTTFDILFVSV